MEELPKNAGRFVEEDFEQDRTLSYLNALGKKLSTKRDKHTDGLKEAVRKRVIEAV